MTSIVFQADSDGAIRGFSVCGHTGFSDEGSDIVCAAVSAVTDFTLHLLLDTFGAKANYQSDGRSATVRFSLCAKASWEQNDETIQGVLRGYRDYLRDLCDAYPRNVEIITEGFSC